ncbi:MAG: hypothetical protein Q7S33_01800 [Nanoarchaeota archaeon]|nr:hypothetical protein [Nanoarchaeota archaeon]
MEKKKRIVFYVSFEPQIFMYKLAKEFRKRGYETVLFTICEKDKFNWDFYKEVFDKIICSNFEFRKPSLKTIPYFLKRGQSLVKFIIQSKFAKPYVILGSSGINWQIKLARKYFFKKDPFIFYTYDIRSQFFASKQEALEKNPGFELEAEKYNFEHCDGVIHKGAPDELNYIERRIFDKINFPDLQLSFLPYCSKDFYVPLNKNKLSKKDKELHLVYVGFFWTGQGKEISEFFNKILNQKIHLHIYPIALAYHLPKEQEKEYTQNFFSQCIHNSYFHIHETLPPKKLISEISQYDFGIYPYISRSKNNLEPIFCTGNKIASYLEASIPMVFTKDLNYLEKLMKSYGLNISYDEKNISILNKRLKSLNYPLLEKKVEKAREDYSVEKNFDRLEEFIKQVVTKKNQNRF